MSDTALGREVIYSVISTPDNIANLDAGRNDAAFWAGVREGNISTDEGPRADPQPARVHVGHGHAARQRAGGGRGLDAPALRDGGAPGLLQRAPAAEPDDVHRPGHQPGRP